LAERSFGSQDSLVVYANHASWWDPLTAIFLGEELFSGFELYAPIDQEAFQKYRIFGQMGFYPVDQKTLQGAKDFLRISHGILSMPRSSIWLTPEGRFVDVRDTKAALMPGLAHLASSVASKNRHHPEHAGNNVWFIPAAVEYTFWQERLPELLVCMGKPLCVTAERPPAVSGDRGAKQEWNEELSQRLRAAQAHLAVAAQQRDTSEFEVYLKSSGRTFFVYDWIRRARSLLSRKKFEGGHGKLFSDE
jgi:1-acyl-sn-glycerol-3-phosphate acyltransferase